ncbi:MAG: Rrf2 family transcriptional regulator [Hyphomonadaceae bacterium]|nr:Rrf2 family transcriptional regulator [Hyphomonadaceae bacterium]
MKMSEGVEWTAHACTLLAALPPGIGLSAAALAEFHDLAPAYMAKHMQALARAGVVESVRGAGGGYRLARKPHDVTLWDIYEAIEGEEPAFRCSEIRQQGPCPGIGDFRKPCEINAIFGRAETAWKAELKSMSLADIVADLARKQTPARRAQLTEWLGEKLG